MGLLPIPLIPATTSTPNFESRSNRRNLFVGAYGHASRICCTIQSALGFRVTLKWRIFRRSWPMTKKRKYSKRQGRYREEVHGCNGLAMIPQECGPALGRIGK